MNIDGISPRLYGTFSVLDTEALARFILANKMGLSGEGVGKCFSRDCVSENFESHSIHTVGC